MTPAAAYSTKPRGRVFPTAELAAAYERGFSEWPRVSDECDLSAEYRAGWLDREHKQELRDEARADLDTEKREAA